MVVRPALSHHHPCPLVVVVPPAQPTTPAYRVPASSRVVHMTDPTLSRQSICLYTPLITPVVDRHPPSRPHHPLAAHSNSQLSEHELQVSSHVVCNSVCRVASRHRRQRPLPLHAVHQITSVWPHDQCLVHWCHYLAVQWAAHCRVQWQAQEPPPSHHFNNIIVVWQRQLRTVALHLHHSCPHRRPHSSHNHTRPTPYLMRAP